MSIVKMSRLTLVGLTEQKADVMDALIRLGAVEMDEREGATEPVVESFDDRLFMSLNAVSRLELAVDYCRQRDAAGQKLGSDKRTVDVDDFLHAGQREQEIMQELRLFEQAQEQIFEIKTAHAQDATLQELLAPWRSLAFDLSVTGTRETSVFVGAFPDPESAQKFQTNTEQEAPETHVEWVDEQDTGIRAVIVTLKAHEITVHSSLRQYGFHALPAQGLRGTPAQILEQIDSRAKDYAEHLERLEKELADSTAHGRDFELLHDFYLMRSDKIEALRNLPGTASTFYLVGWIPAKIAAKTAEALKSKFLVAVETREPTADEEPPVQFKNNRFVKPFEVIVEMYAPPSSADIDPTPILAPFFFFFFGLMLADVGYGLVLVILTGWLVFKKKATGEMGRLAHMLFLSGIGAIIFGLLFGGFFGDMLTVISQGRIVVPSFWFNPMNEPIKMMIWSMVFGVLHLFTAMGAKIYLLVRSGQWFDALVDIVPWYLVIIGLGLMISGNSIIPGVSLSFAGQVMAIAGAAVVLLFGGRSAKNPIMRLFGGLGALYSVTGYFSDILSYTRILALVLAGSVIAMVINLLGFMLGPTPAGYLMFAAVALFGHTLNLALSVLGAYVHTSRLQYVEFFSKFYEGGGRIFKPLHARTRFIRFEQKK